MLVRQTPTIEFYQSWMRLHLNRNVQSSAWQQRGAYLLDFVPLLPGVFSVRSQTRKITPQWSSETPRGISTANTVTSTIAPPSLRLPLQRTARVRHLAAQRQHRSRLNQQQHHRQQLLRQFRPLLLLQECPRSIPQKLQL